MTNTTDLKQRFFNALKRGTGEAYLIAKANPTIDFSSYIIQGALKNYAYHGQFEGSRAEYIMDLITTSNKKEKIRKAILTGLATEQKDTWSLVHLFELAKLFAKQGDNEARQAIYDRFLTNPIMASDWVGDNEILELDGLQGLFYIAEKFGKVIEQNSDYALDSHIIVHFQDDNPTINVKEELKKEAKKNKYVRLYLNNIRQTEKNWTKQKSVPITYNDIIDEVLGTKPYFGYWIKKELTNAELKKIANRLLTETDLKNKEKLLYVFTNHKFPFNNEFILNLATQRPTSKNLIREFAIEALKHCKSKNIREFALTNIKETKNPERFVIILLSNFKKGDSRLLTEVANKIKNEDKIEILASSYVAIFELNKTKECKKPLETLYNKMNCGIHRNYIVKILIKNKVLSNRIKKEINYDSYLETRKLLKRNK